MKRLFCALALLLLASSTYAIIPIRPSHPDSFYTKITAVTCSAGVVLAESIYSPAGDNFYVGKGTCTTVVLGIVEISRDTIYKGRAIFKDGFKSLAERDTVNNLVGDTAKFNYTAPRSGTTVKSTAAIDSMTKAVADSFVGDGTKIKNTRMSPRYISFVAGGVWPTAALSFVTTSDTGGLGTSYVLKNADSTSVDSFVTSVIKPPDSLNTADSVRFCFNFYKPSAQADTSHWHIYSAICSTGSAKWTAQVVDSFNYINTGSIWLSNYAKQAYTYAVLGWKQGEHVQLKFSVYNNRVLYLKSVDVTLPQR